MTWGWLVAMVGIQSVAASMAELCSSMPTSGQLSRHQSVRKGNQMLTIVVVQEAYTMQRLC